MLLSQVFVYTLIEDTKLSFIYIFNLILSTIFVVDYKEERNKFQTNVYIRNLINSPSAYLSISYKC